MKSKAISKPKLLDQSTQIFHAMGTRQRKVLLTGLVVLFMMVGLTTLILAYSIYQPQLTTLLQGSTPTRIPTATPRCVRPTLSMGAYSYPLDVFTLTDEKTIPILAKPAGTAWWISDTFSPFVFIFMPALGSLDMQSALTPGDRLVVQWADCGREEFVLTDFQPGIPDGEQLLAQNSPGIDIIVQSVGGKDEYIIHGQRP